MKWHSNHKSWIVCIRNRHLYLTLTAIVSKDICIWHRHLYLTQTSVFVFQDDSCEYGLAYQQSNRRFGEYEVSVIVAHDHPTGGLDSVLCVFHSTSCILVYTLYAFQYTLYCLQYTLYSVIGSLSSIQCYLLFQLIFLIYVGLILFCLIFDDFGFWFLIEKKYLMRYLWGSCKSPVESTDKVVPSLVT